MLISNRRDGVWEKDEYKDEKKLLLMKLDEVENCTFAPVVRSKLPEKLKINPENQNILYGPPEADPKKREELYRVEIYLM
jgi:hypothetical protein